MTFDFDDFCDEHNQLERFYALKRINPLFRCTVFAIPGRCSESFLRGVPRWIELAVHGWLHPDPRECEHWSRADVERVLDSGVVRRHFVNGWKSPGWQISDATYEVLLERGWWVADQHLEDGRRPEGLRAYFYEDGGWHGHITDVCGNGIEETWPRLVDAVKRTTEFRFCSEMAR